MDLASGFLAAHLQDHCLKYITPQWETPPFTLDPRLYRVYFPRAAVSTGFLVEGCEGQATIHTNLWIHFLYRHVQDTIVILE